MADLTPRELTLLTLSLAGGQPLSPVQLQKAVFLLQKRAELLPSNDQYQFDPHHYGPFCKEVYFDARDLSREGLVGIAPVVGTDYASYCATAEGVRDGLAIADRLSPEKLQYARTLVAWVLSLGFKELVSSIYKTYPEYLANSIFKQ